MTDINTVTAYYEHDKDGIDSDTSDKLMNPQSSRIRIGCRSGVSSADDEGLIENIKSNLQKVFPLVGGTNHCVGSCIGGDGFLYFFIACTPPMDIVVPYTDGIWRYNKSTGIVEPVLLQYNQILVPSTHTVYLLEYHLNFDRRYKINNPRVWQGLIYWTETVPEGLSPHNQPRKVNIEKAVNFCHNVFPSYPASPMKYPAYVWPTDDDITVIKPQPQYAPIPKYFNLLIDTNGNRIYYNNLRGQLFKFAYRYKFDDNEYSKYSSHSVVPLPNHPEDIVGVNNPIIENDNCIRLVLNTGQETVVALEIVAKFGDSKEVNGAGVWYLVDTIEKYDINKNKLYDDNDLIQYYFLNDKTKVAIVQADAEELYDDVPLYCNNIEIIDEGRLIPGDNTEDKDPTSIAIVLNSLKIPVDLLTTNLPLFVDTTWLKHHSTHVVNDYFIINLPVGRNLVVGNYIVINVVMDNWTSHTYNYLIISDDVTDPDAIYGHIKAFLVASGLDPDKILTEIDDYDMYGNFIIIAKDLLWIESDRYSYSGFFGTKKGTPDGYIRSVTASMSGVSTKNKYKTAKTGFYHNYSVVYKDQFGRCQAVNQPAGGFRNTIYIETQIHYPGIAAILSDTHQISYELYNIPPLWAYTYQWMIQKPLYQYLYFALGNFTKVTPHTQPSDDYTGSLKLDGNYLKLHLNTDITALVSDNQNQILSPWQYQKGDRIRFVALRDNTGNYIPLYDNIDVEIKGESTSLPKDILVDVFDLDPATGYSALPKWDNALVEIYRPRRQTQTENDVWYEIGTAIPILDPGTVNRRHGAGIPFTIPPNIPHLTYPIGQEQTLIGEPATGLLEGDTYFRLRYTGISIAPYVPVESDNYSDFYDSYLHDYGKSNAIIRDAKQERKKSQFNISDRAIRDTRTNGMSTFTALRNTVLDESKGAITGIRQVGGLLKVIQEKKVNTYEIHKLEVSRINTGGTEFMITTEQIIGMVNPSDMPYGCTNPESISVFGDWIWFWDRNNSAFIRDSYNGMRVISDYKQKKTFGDIAVAHGNATVNGVNLFRCYTGFDVKNNELHVTFINELDDSFRKTLVFLETGEEGTGRWKSFQPWYPERYDYIDGLLVMWYHGGMYLHEQGTDYMMFFGQKYKQQLSATGNGKLMGVKNWKSVELRTNNNKIGTFPTAMWSVKSAIVPPDKQNTTGMETIIPVNKFVSKEGGIFAEFMKDINTPGNQPTNWKLLNGREMRGETIEVLFENDSNERVVVSNIKINSVESKSGNP